MFSANTTQVSSAANYIEDVFSTYLYTGNGSTQTITNGIDLAGKGGMLWTKARANAYWNMVVDTARGMDNAIFTNATDASGNFGTNVISPTSSGFTLANNYNFDNLNANTYASWTFRKQPKFFDVVTYTGNGTASRAISHSLGAAPGVMIVKRTDAAQNWAVYHRSVPTGTGYLNSTAAFATGAGNGVFGDSSYNNIAPTSTVFYVGSDPEVNANGGTYVAYLFAHDAGGFGLTGTDNVISCGSFSSTAAVSLGWEPQWILFKRTDTIANWTIVDSMRGLPGYFASAQRLRPNTADAEGTDGILYINSTGFVPEGYPGGTYIYIAIRRGPMKTPTSGTSVFSPQAATQTLNSVSPPAAGFPVDSFLFNWTNGGYRWNWVDRLKPTFLVPSQTDAESSQNFFYFDNQTGVRETGNYEGTSNPFVFYNFRRAPGFFDEVCYTGNGTSGATQTHNLGVVPELMIVKTRSGAAGWNVYSAATGNTKVIYLDGTGAAFTFSGSWNNTTPTSTVFTLGNDAEVNGSGSTYVAYLFATLAGVSKVGSYTGTGTTKQIDCGFTGGARFVLIRRTDSTGDWYVWDSARGIVAGNDPYLLINSNAAQVTSTDYIDTYSAGFEISSTAPAAINANGGTFIFLAIA